MSELITVDDLLDIRQVSEAQLHPDGAPIVYVVSSAVGDHKDRKGTSEIWMTGGEGEARRLTAEGTVARHPRWSADGSRLGFIGRRAGQESDQFFVIDVGWGEAEALTACESEVQAFEWSPDGRQVALLMTDTDPDGDRERRESGRDQIEYEHHHRYCRIWLLEVETGNLRRLTDEEMQVWELAWSPDGDRLAAIVADEPYNWSWYRSRLVGIDAESGNVSLLYDPPKTITRPVWSPDGSRLALLSCTWSDQGMTGGDVLLFDSGGGEPMTITEQHPRSYTELEWEPDGDGLVATAVEDGQAAICRLDLDGTCQVLWKEQATIPYFSSKIFTRDRTGRRMAVVRADPEHPADVWTFDLDSATWRQQTTTNPQLAGKTMHRLETHYWPSFDGTSIHGLVMRPAGADGPLPMVVLVHGGPTGVTGYDFPSHRTHGWAYLLASAGYAVLMPNPRGSMGFGTAFAEANIGDMGGGDLADILAGVDYCVETGIADPERLGVGGWSYGGYMAAWVVTQTQRFKASIAGAPITNWTSFHGVSTIPAFDSVFYASDPYNADGIYTFRSPIYHVRDVTTPVLFLQGEQDPICPPGQSHEMWRALRELGVDTRLVIYPREGHGPREREHVRDLLDRVVGWFTRYV